MLVIFGFGLPSFGYSQLSICLIVLQILPAFFLDKGQPETSALTAFLEGP